MSLISRFCMGGDGHHASPFPKSVKGTEEIDPSKQEEQTISLIPPIITDLPYFFKVSLPSKVCLFDK